MERTPLPQVTLNGILDQFARLSTDLRSLPPSSAADHQRLIDHVAILGRQINLRGADVNTSYGRTVQDVGGNAESDKHAIVYEAATYDDVLVLFDDKPVGMLTSFAIDFDQSTLRFGALVTEPPAMHFTRAEVIDIFFRTRDRKTLRHYRFKTVGFRATPALIQTANTNGSRAASPCIEEVFEGAFGEAIDLTKGVAKLERFRAEPAPMPPLRDHHAVRDMAGAEAQVAEKAQALIKQPGEDPGPGRVVTEAMLRKATSGPPMSATPTPESLKGIEWLSAGIHWADEGTRTALVIAGREAAPDGVKGDNLGHTRVLFFRTFSGLKPIEEIAAIAEVITAYDKAMQGRDGFGDPPAHMSIVGMAGGGSGPLSMDMLRHYVGIVERCYKCRYAGDFFGPKFSWNKDAGMFSLNRNRAIEETMNAFSRNRIQLPTGDGGQLTEMYAAVLAEFEEAGEIKVWRKDTDAHDELLHAVILGRFASLKQLP